MAYRTSKKKPDAKASFEPVEPLTANQAKYIEAIKKNDITFCLGPAGSGKTRISAGIGAELLVNNQFERLILTRPICALEDIGFLPGSFEEKIRPYLLPLYDELKNFINVHTYLKQGKIVVEPIAYLRGRTLKDSFIIIDEAQNCTYSQLKMLLTRLGDNSVMVVEGDPSQSDLPLAKIGGLEKCAHLLADIDEIGIVHLDKSDIVRHPLVEKILARLE